MFSKKKDVHDPDFQALAMDQVDAEESMFESEDEIAEMWADQELKPIAERKPKKSNIFNQRQQSMRKMSRSDKNNEL